MSEAVHPGQRFAVIGSGISGLAAAYLLAPHHNVTVYEKNGYIGGHSRTVEVHTADGMVPVDTGFIVFNDRNYPLLRGLFAHLGVETAKSDMSFGVSIDGGRLEYGTRRLHHLFAQKANLVSLRFWRMLRDILTFNKTARSYLQSDPSLSLGQCLERLNLGPWFHNYYLLPMGGAIWSTPLAQIQEFPAQTFIRFFDQHGLLTVNDQPQWYTVVGGSREYVKRLSAGFADRIRLNCGVKKVQRTEQGVTICDHSGHTEAFDGVVFACHADQAHRLIAQPTKDEQEILGQFRYQGNRMVLHGDVDFMPKRSAAWASWVYLSESQRNGDQRVSLSYWMNNLQPLKTTSPIIVTLNPLRDPQENLIYDEYGFEHPVFDERAIRAQMRIEEIQGRDRLWFCGAYQRYGFHEDGLLSATKMAEKMGIRPQWM